MGSSDFDQFAKSKLKLKIQDLFFLILVKNLDQFLIIKINFLTQLSTLILNKISVLLFSNSFITSSSITLCYWLNLIKSKINLNLKINFRISFKNSPRNCILMIKNKNSIFFQLCLTNFSNFKRFLKEIKK